MKLVFSKRLLLPILFTIVVILLVSLHRPPPIREVLPTTECKEVSLSWDAVSDPNAVYNVYIRYDKIYKDGSKQGIIKVDGKTTQTHYHIEECDNYDYFGVDAHYPSINDSSRIVWLPLKEPYLHQSYID